MDEEWISKKDLLQLTGISYGQLYRWKRKNLIPEEWFVRKSTFTGQETFFPKAKMLTRLQKILNMKEERSLDELARVLSPTPAQTELGAEEILERGIVSKLALDLFLQQSRGAARLSFDQILFVYILDRLLQDGEISLDEGKLLLEVLADCYPRLRSRDAELALVRKMGVSAFVLYPADGQCYFDGSVRIVLRLPLSRQIEELKVQLSQ